MAHRSLLRPLRPARLVAGLLVVAVAVLAIAALVADAGDRDRVLALRRDVAAGAELTAADVEVVAVGVSPGIAAIGAARIDEVVGQVARYRLAAGALLTADAVQAGPLVSAGHVLMAIPVSVGELPGGLVAGDPVLVVIAPPVRCVDRTPAVVAATVAVTPQTAPLPQSRTRPAAASLSIEVAAGSITLVAGGEAFTVARPNGRLAPTQSPAPGSVPCPAAPTESSSRDGERAQTPSPPPTPTVPGTEPVIVVPRVPTDLVVTTITAGG